MPGKKEDGHNKPLPKNDNWIIIEMTPAMRKHFLFNPNDIRINKSQTPLEDFIKYARQLSKPSAKSRKLQRKLKNAFEKLEVFDRNVEPSRSLPESNNETEKLEEQGGENYEENPDQFTRSEIGHSFG